jgi:DNA primase
MSDLRDNVLHAVDIVDLVGKYVTIKKTWKNRVGVCPFHKEHTPSFTVAEDKQIFKCFWCGKWGNAITFLMEIERIDFWDALTTLAKQHHIEIPVFSGQNKDHHDQMNTTREKIKRINRILQDFFVHSMKTADLVQTYLSSTRKLSQNTIQFFGLGYAPDSGYAYIQMLKQQWFTGDDLIQAWVAKMIGQDIVAFFKDRVTFPIYDHMGTIVGFGARALHPDQQPKYLNSTETPLYDKSKILYGMNTAKTHSKEQWFLMVVEWYMDVIATAQYGLPVAVATCGTALTQHHAKALKRQAENIVFAFDNDAAWKEATARWLKVAFSVDLFPKVLEIPTQYKDIDEWCTARSEPLTPEVINAMSNDAFEGVMNRTFERMDSRNPIQRKQITTYLFDILVYLQDYSVLLLYLDMLASKLGLPTDALVPEFKRYHIQAMRQWVRPVDTTYTKTTQQSQATTQRAPGEWWLSQESLVHALIHDGFYTSLAPQHSAEILVWITNFKEAMPYLQEHVAENLEKKWGANDDEHMLKEAQLWWEHTVENLNSQKAYHHISRFMKAYIQKGLQEAMKNKLLTTNQKQDILSILQRITLQG